MKKTILCSIALLTIGISGFAQKSNSILWEITGKGIEKPSYIFGTIHITCDATLKDKVKKALDKTDRLYLEIDMDDPEMMQKMMGSIAMKDNKRLSEMLTKEQIEKLDLILKDSFNITTQMIDNYKPFFIHSMLYTKMINCPMQSFETELMKVSKEQNEEIFGLETIESQIAIFDRIPYQSQINDLMIMVDNINNKDFSEMDKMMSYYNSEDLKGLMKLIENSSISSNNQYNEELLITRNKNWIPIIEEKAKEKATFFGVGAAHLSGKNGVITLLKKQGYKLKPIK